MHKCEACSIVFSRKQAYETHLKSKKHAKRSEPNKLHVCGCGKSYSCKQSLYVHKKKCNKKSCKNPIDSIMEQLEKVQQKNEELEEELKQLKAVTNNTTKVQTNRRIGINKHIRNEVICKQSSQCNKCTKPLTEYNTNVDHKLGVQFGGTNNVDNLQALCVECHSEKTIKETRNRKRIHDAIQQILSE